jgi:hypothetical protein
MGLKSRRKIWTVGGSKALSIPRELKHGKEATLAANRFIFLDPRGEISEDDLLSFLEEHIEPQIWPWLQSLRKSSKKD